MTKPFITPDHLLEKKKYSLKYHEAPSDDFLIDKKYKDRLTSAVSKEKIKHFFIFVFLIIFLLLVRVFYLQIIKGKEYRLIAEGNRIKTETLTSARGIFYDRYHNVLVSNIPKFSLLVERDILNQTGAKQDKLIEKISFLTHLSKKEILEKLSNESQSQSDSKDILISRDVDYEKALILKVDQEKYPGLKLQLTPKRKYIDSSLSHILGYLGKIDAEEWQRLKKQNYQFIDLVGKAGLEKEYEKLLRGQPGKIEKEVNAQGKVIKILSYQEPLPGKNIILTIDQKLNQKLTQILIKHTKQINKTKAAAIALDPQTGEVLALVSLPGFNNNIFSDPQKFKEELNQILTDKNQPLFNRAISGEYPSGSTIKPAIAAAGLEEGLINERTRILSTGGIRIDKWFFPDWKPGGHGPTNVTKALAESVNTFFYYLGGGYQDFKGLGLEKITRYAKKFGFGHTLGIDLPEEAPGFLPTKSWKEKTKNEKWYIGDTYHLSIGQGDILVTPLQITNLMVCIANGGKVLKPHLVKEIVDVDKKTKTVIEPEIIRQNFIKDENIKIVKKGLRQAVLYGSARSLNELPFSSAGKTGTAQVGSKQEPHAWFTVFAPYENPEIVLTVLIENGGEGSSTALPVAKEVLRWYFSEHH